MQRWVLVLATVACVTLLAGCGQEPYEDRSLDELRSGFADHGLDVCDTGEADVDLPGAVDTTTFEVALDCENDDEALVSATAFDDVDDRDGAAAQYALESTRGIGRGLNNVWTFGPYVVVLSGPRDDAAAEAVTETLDSLAA